MRFGMVRLSFSEVGGVGGALLTVVCVPGTNDLGSDAFLTDSQVPGKDQTDYVDCIFEQVQRLYDVGGRYFVLFNNAPLDLAPLYTDGPTYSPDDAAPDNGTRTYERMRTQVAMVNSIFDYRAPVEVLLEKRFPGIRLAVFNVHDLVSGGSVLVPRSIEMGQEIIADACPDGRYLRQPDCLPERHDASQRHRLLQLLR